MRYCDWCKRRIAEGEEYWYAEIKDPHILVVLCKQCYERLGKSDDL